MPRTVQVATPELLRERLARFERKYGLSSAEFLQRWEAGLMEEHLDFFEWAGLCLLAERMGILTPLPSSRPLSTPSAAPRPHAAG